MGIKDSHDLALSDWMGSAQFDREEDLWPRRWAEAYVDFAAGEKRVVAAGDGAPGLPRGRLGRARRRPGRRPRELGAALPHHVGDRARAWSSRSSGGCGSTRRRGRIRFAFRHRVDELVVDGRRRSPASAGRCWRPTRMDRGKASNRDEVGDFELTAQAVIVSSGGIGGDHDLVREGLARAARYAAGVHGQRRARPTSTAG